MPLDRLKSFSLSTVISCHFGVVSRRWTARLIDYHLFPRKSKMRCRALTGEIPSLSIGWILPMYLLSDSDPHLRIARFITTRSLLYLFVPMMFV